MVKRKRGEGYIFKGFPPPPQYDLPVDAESGEAVPMPVLERIAVALERIAAALERGVIP